MSTSSAIAHRIGEAFESTFSPNETKEDNVELFIAKLTADSDTQDLLDILTHLVHQRAWPHILSSYRKISQGKPSPGETGIGGLVQPSKDMKTTVVPQGSGSVYTPPKLDSATILKYATIEGVPLLECTADDIIAAIDKNLAKMAGYQNANARLIKLHGKYADFNVLTFSECNETQLDEVIEIWQS